MNAASVKIHELVPNVVLDVCLVLDTKLATCVRAQTENTAWPLIMFVPVRLRCVIIVDLNAGESELLVMLGHQASKELRGIGDGGRHAG